MMTRKQFFVSLAGLAGLAVVGACASDDGGKDPGPTDDAGSDPGPGQDGGTPGTPSDSGMPTPDASSACSAGSASIGANHGHALSVPAADVTAGVTKTYSITGTSGHPHNVEITSQMFTTLKANRTLTVTSSTGAGHTHSVTITC